MASNVQEDFEEAGDDRYPFFFPILTVDSAS